MRTPGRYTLLRLALLAWVALHPALAAPTPAGLDEAGRVGQRLYREGVGASGQALQARVQKGVALSGADVACVKCHRRSGLGGGEGQNTIRPISGRYLFTAPDLNRWARQGASGARPPERPIYTQATLAKALREGVDPAGRKLDPLMPRFDLSDAEVAGLHAYLGGLSQAAAPGVTRSELHFATILTPDADPARASAMLAVLQAFFKDKNGGTRNESRRRAVGSEEMYRVYRTWALHPWRLTGAPETWRGQLEAYYRDQPVFAVIGGLGGGEWQPVHGFCEQMELPCIFPDVDHPPLGEPGYYSLYFSRGVTLEAEVLGRQLAQAGQRQTGRIAQVYRDDAPGRGVARDFRAALERLGIGPVADHPVAASGPVSDEFWSDLLGEGRPDTLVVWLDAAGVESLGQWAGQRGEGTAGQNAAPPAPPPFLYISSSLSGLRAASLPDGWLDKARLVYPFGLPESRKPQMARLKAWLRARDIPFEDERAQANAFFAASIAGDSIYHMGDNFSRDYFIERLEQMAGSTLFSSVYPHLSLGPGQRFASRGGYIVRISPGGDSTPQPVSDWVVP